MRMDNLLMITNADMSLQSGNVVLINRRAEEIYKQFGVKTICMIVGKNAYKQINHSFKGINFMSVLNREEIKNYIKNNRPRKVIFYGIGSFLYIPYVKKYIEKTKLDIEVLLDIQGALQERLEYEKGLKLFENQVRHLIRRIIFSQAIKKSNGAFVVSDEMKNYCTSFLDKKKLSGFQTYKIRCGINQVITTTQKQQWRKEVRNKFGVDDDTIVMVFSGYRMAWQRVDEIIDLFKKYDHEMDKVFFAFFCNIDDEFRKKLEESFPKKNYTLNFLSFEDYFKYLCACDIGFLKRDYNVTNNVAFPNKFSDYLNAGLMIAMNSALPEPHRVLRDNDMKFIDIEDANELFNTEEILKRQKNIVAFYKKTENLCQKELLYSNQVRKSNLIT